MTIAKLFALQANAITFQDFNNRFNFVTPEQY